MWQLVVGPVLLALIIGGVLFIYAGPFLAGIARDVWDWILDTIEEIKEIWRS